MPYWGTDADECDFAFDSMGATIHMIIERMKKDIKVVIEKGYSEQSIIAHLVCLRLIGERFPKNLSVSFGEQDLQEASAAFDEWFAKVGPKIPRKVRDGVLANAKKEIALFSQHFDRRNNDG